MTQFTLTQLDKHAKTLCLMARRPTEIYTVVGSTLPNGSNANVGNLHVRATQEGNKIRYALYSVINEAGGVQAITNKVTGPALAKTISVMIAGASLVRVRREE